MPCSAAARRSGSPDGLVALDLVHPLPRAGEHRLGAEQAGLARLGARLAGEERLLARLQRGGLDGRGIELAVELGLGDAPSAVEGDDRVLPGLPGGDPAGRVGELLGDGLDLPRLGLPPLAEQAQHLRLGVAAAGAPVGSAR